MFFYVQIWYKCINDFLGSYLGFALHYISAIYPPYPPFDALFTALLPNKKVDDAIMMQLMQL